ncbi:uncharacterized protein LOC129600398 [Paramacrobiotus metropolitanus]|uniref:uncharacterized protein LOC129600398 n=1 Tax=Paramacrobiotus metropolitanus TaxID=2943436 RepID=UPI002445C745|nr:uncharacterized protein LOC129600398 [Paramacrobiotus metropolitanus]XP_055354867.1 uncharacterized protein LOC129600398 [Paramacrobiotus metropolitanus]
MHLLEKILLDVLLALLRPASDKIQACTVSKGPSHRPGPRTLLDGIVDDGVGIRRADIIQLQFPSSPAVNPASVATDWQIRRPRLGAEVTMTCEIPESAAINIISWTHHGVLVFDQGRAVPLRAGGSNWGNFSFSQSSIVAFFRITNVTIHSSGEVVCLLLKDLVRDQHDTLRRYKILPRLRSARDLFVDKMQDVWTKVGESVMFKCSVSISLPKYMVTDYRNKWMWRHNGRVIAAPCDEPYRTFLGPYWRHTTLKNVTSSGTDDDPQETVSYRMYLKKLTPNDGGPVECWFRLYPDLHEWIRQTVNLNVIGSNL